MRKAICIVLSLLFAIIPITAFASDDGLSLVNVRASVLADASSGKILYNKNGNERLPIASVTKVMTLILAFEAIQNGQMSLEEKVTVSENASSMGGSQAFIDASYEYSVGDLIKSIIVASANDSAVAIAERLQGSEQAFVNKMNQKARALGMDDTMFKNCTGLPQEGHLSTALDVAKMSCELVKYEDYFSYSRIWTDKLYHEKDGRYTELVNTNKLIRSLSGCDGIKTGSTSEAKFCIAATAERDNMRLISVVLGGSTSKDRFEAAATLINYGFADYENKTVALSGERITEVSVENGACNSVILVAGKGYSTVIKNDGSDKLETVIDVPESISAPIHANDVIGHMRVLLNGEEIRTVELVAEADCEKADFFTRFKRIISFWDRE